MAILFCKAIVLKKLQMGEDDKAKWVYAGVATVCTATATVAVVAMVTHTPIRVKATNGSKSLEVEIGKTTAGSSKSKQKLLITPDIVPMLKIYQKFTIAHCNK